MTVTVWTNYRDTCVALMFNYAAVFTEGVHSDGGDGSLIWLHYTSDQTRHFWKSWLKAAEKVGLIYNGEVK